MVSRLQDLTNLRLGDECVLPIAEWRDWKPENFFSIALFNIIRQISQFNAGNFL